MINDLKIETNFGDMKPQLFHAHPVTRPSLKNRRMDGQNPSILRSRRTPLGKLAFVPMNHARSRVCNSFRSPTQSPAIYVAGLEFSRIGRRLPKTPTGKQPQGTKGSQSQRGRLGH